MRKTFFSEENYLGNIPILEMQFILKDDCNIFKNEECFNLKTDFLNVSLLNTNIISTISQVHKTEYDNIFLFYYSIDIGKLINPDKVTHQAIRNFIVEVNQQLRNIFTVYSFVGVFDIYQGFENGIKPDSTFAIHYNNEFIYFALTNEKRINEKWDDIIKNLSAKIYNRYPSILKNDRYNWL